MTGLFGGTVARRIRQAFVLGAGLGTRLRPLTEHRPKPLVPVCNRPLILYAFDHLIAAGIENIVVNTHHAPECYDTLLGSGRYCGVPIEFVHEPVLLETGGGIRNVADRFGDEPFFVYNGDVFTDLDLVRLSEAHFASGAEITLAVRSEGGPLHLAISEGRVVDIRARYCGLEGTHLFTGLYVVDPRFAARIPAGEAVSVVPVWGKMIESGEYPAAVILDDGFWRDVGTRDAYLDVNADVVTGTLRPAYWSTEDAPTAVSEGASIGVGATVGSGCVIAAGCAVGEGARLERTVLWEGARVAAGAELEGCVVREGREVGGVHRGVDF